MAVTTAELVARVAANLGLKKATVRRVYDDLVEEIIDGVKESGAVYLKGFGKIDNTDTSPARRFRTPDGKIAERPARRVPKFRISPEVKKQLIINEGEE